MAFQGNGTDQNLTLADDAALTIPNDDVSFGGWVKISDNTGSGYQAFLSWNDVNATSLFLGVIETSEATNPNKLWFQIKDASNTDAIFSNTTPGTSENWQHVFVVRSGSTWTLYSDGVNVGTAPVTVGEVNYAGDLYALSKASAPAAYFNGALEGWKKWDRALSAAEIAALAGGANPEDYTEDEKWELLGDGFYAETVASITVTNSGTTVVAGPSQLRFSGAPRLVSGSSQAWSFNPTSLLSDTIGGVFAWIKVPSVTAAAPRTIYCIGDEDGDMYFHLSLNTGGELRAVCVIGGTVQFIVETDAAAVAANTWTRVGVVQDGVAVKLKVGGSEPAQTADTSTDLTKWFAALTNADVGRIGCFNGNSTGNVTFFDGAICEVPVLSELALSTAQVIEDYNVGLGIDPYATSYAGSVAGYYLKRVPFTLDWSGKGNDLTAINSAGAVKTRKIQVPGGGGGIGGKNNQVFE